MGQYLALDFTYGSAVSPARLLAPLFTAPWFTPIALGGIATAGSRGDHWFLAGYALEDFVALFTRRGFRPVLSTDVGAVTTAEHAYLATVATAIMHQTRPTEHYSPYEMALPNKGATFVPTVRLDMTALAGLERWVARFPRQSLHLYGTVTLATDSAVENEWPHAFRMLYRPEDMMPVIGAPIVQAWIVTHPAPGNQLGLTLYSASSAWLTAGQAFQGYVGAGAAERNLAQLVTLAHHIAMANRTDLHATELSIEGGRFQQERHRIETAFARLIESGDSANAGRG